MKTQSPNFSDVPLFQGLSVAQKNILNNSLKEVSFKKGDMIYFEGKPCDHIYIVHSGRVKIFRSASTGREQILEVLDMGDTCACNPGISSWCCSSSAQAMTDCVLWVMPRQQYVNFVKFNSKMAGALNQLLATRLQKLSSLIEGVSLDDPKRRLVKFILDLAGEDTSGKTSHSFELRFTHEEIAQRLGLVRETVTRHLQQLKLAKLISFKTKQIAILDRNGLEKILK